MYLCIKQCSFPNTLRGNGGKKKLIDQPGGNGITVILWKQSSPEFPLFILLSHQIELGTEITSY